MTEAAPLVEAMTLAERRETFSRKDSDFNSRKENPASLELPVS